MHISELRFLELLNSSLILYWLHNLTPGTFERGEGRASFHGIRYGHQNLGSWRHWIRFRYYFGATFKIITLGRGGLGTNISSYTCHVLLGSVASKGSKGDTVLKKDIIYQILIRFRTEAKFISGSCRTVITSRQPAEISSILLTQKVYRYNSISVRI